MVHHLVSMTSTVRSQGRYKLYLVVASLLLAALVASCGKSREPAPDFEATLFDGSSFQLADQVDEKVVVLNFWYPSCPPCRAEMPEFQEAWQEVQDEEVRFLGLFVPQLLDTEQDARDFVDGLGLTYDFATDVRAETAIAYQVEFFPVTYFIDKDGQIARTHISVLRADDIVQIVREMM